MGLMMNDKGFRTEFIQFIVKIFINITIVVVGILLLALLLVAGFINILISPITLLISLIINKNVTVVVLDWVMDVIINKVCDWTDVQFDNITDKFEMKRTFDA